ncbi:Nodule Cysteine-Rich (NCR) secreted peptide [Medicago truncatula]|uniref:Nodule Cysteine-Rich (NCR) secreted peptide n=1 Tax=Medicago truncatula TaxID=3880 RepID=A0A072USM4_MEDTR|nr:Nodule Cysteine-Rich (NCR) secreted peptide [Medicago truncatula]
MAKIVNYVYSMIIFLFLFLVATKAEPLILISFFITRVYQCIADSDCQPWMCSLGMKPKCISVLRMCKCHGWQKYNVLT